MINNVFVVVSKEAENDMLQLEIQISSSSGKMVSCSLEH